MLIETIHCTSLRFTTQIDLHSILFFSVFTVLVTKRSCGTYKRLILFNFLKIYICQLAQEDIIYVNELVRGEFSTAIIVNGLCPHTITLLSLGVQMNIIEKLESKLFLELWGILVMIQKWQCPDNDLHSVPVKHEALSGATGVKEIDMTILHLTADQNKRSFVYMGAGTF